MDERFTSLALFKRHNPQLPEQLTRNLPETDKKKYFKLN